MTTERSKLILRATGWLLVVLVVALVAASLIFVVGSPTEARRQQADAQREQDLRGIARTVREYSRVHGRLPAKLSDLQDWKWLSNEPKDPVTAKPYLYRTVNRNSFGLGAVFETDTTGPNAINRWAYDGAPGPDVSRHKKGLVWFTFATVSGA